MTALFKTPKQRALPDPIPVVTREDPEIAAAKLREKQAAKLRKGRGASILTGQSQEGLGAAEVDRPGGESFGG